GVTVRAAGDLTLMASLVDPTGPVRAMIAPATVPPGGPKSLDVLLRSERALAPGIYSGGIRLASDPAADFVPGPDLAYELSVGGWIERRMFALRLIAIPLSMVLAFLFIVRLLRPCPWGR